MFGSLPLPDLRDVVVHAGEVRAVDQAHARGEADDLLQVVEEVGGGLDVVGLEGAPDDLEGLLRYFGDDFRGRDDEDGPAGGFPGKKAAGLLAGG